MCPHCLLIGVVGIVVSLPLLKSFGEYIKDRFVDKYVDCPDCNNSNKDVSNFCRTCAGSGKILKDCTCNCCSH
jgi:RecJ-like exonuclease